MEISYIKDQTKNEFYKININTLLIKSNTWELWNKQAKGWTKEKVVEEKDYQAYINPIYKVEGKGLVEIGDIIYFITSQDANKLLKDLLITEEKKEKEELQEQLGEVKYFFEKLEVENLSAEEVKEYKVYIEKILKDLTKEVVIINNTIRKNKIGEYKTNIKEAVKAKQLTDINKLSEEIKELVVSSVENKKKLLANETKKSDQNININKSLDIEVPDWVDYKKINNL